MKLVQFRWRKVANPLCAWTVVTIATCFATSTYADTTISPPNWPVVDNKANLAHDPASRVVFGQFELVLEKNTLEEFRTAIGSGEIMHQGDASESLT